MSLRTTKFSFPPVRDRLVPRPRLSDRLACGLRGPLTLLSAPAGYGKTTLLSEWRTGIGHDTPAAWVSLDAGDADLTHLLCYLAAALDSLQTGLVGNTLLLLRSAQPSPLETILTSFVNDLSAFPGDFVLVLDDYHAITSPAIHHTMALLLAHAPPQMHLAILTREDPPLPLSKLRARGHLTEIREVDLRFSLAETAAFLTQTMGLTLSAEAIAGLAERTEGWIAGLQMAGLSLQQRHEPEEFVAAFRGQDRYVMDFFMDEVFTLQPEEIQGFLLQTSILERLCGPLCDAVVGRPGSGEAGRGPDSLIPHTPNSQSILEYLEHANLFVLPLDNKREWYRFHPLFADLLRYRLQRLHPELLPHLHRRACHWHAQAGNPDEAMKYALATPDQELVADLAEQFLLQMIGSSRLSTYLSWIQNLPDDLVRRRAYLCAGGAWAYALTHQLDNAARYVEWGDRALPGFEPVYSMPDRRWITREEVRGNLVAIRSYADRLRGDPSAAIVHARQALDALPPEALAARCAVALNLGMLHLDAGELDMARRALSEAFEAAERSRGNIFVAVSAHSLLGGILVRQGKLREAERLFQRAIRFWAADGQAAVPIPSVGVSHGWLVAVHYQRNEIAAAQEHLDIVLQSVGPMGIPESTIRATLFQALLAQSRGEFRAAEDWFQQAEQWIEAHPVQDGTQTEWITFRGRFHLMQGDVASAAKLLAAHGVQADDLDGRNAPSSEQLRCLGPRLARYLLLAHVLLAQGDVVRAGKVAGKVGYLAEAWVDSALLLEALALQAVVAAQSRGDAGHALVTLERALNLAAPEGVVRPFLNCGLPLLKLLRRAIAQGIQPAFTHALHAQLAVSERRLAGAGTQVARRAPWRTGAAAGGSGTWLEPLTGREQQILRLLAAGLSSTEVAEELVISVSTARSYMKSIYGKLHAHSRDEAIRMGSQVGLI